MSQSVIEQANSISSWFLPQAPALRKPLLWYPSVLDDDLE
ncbi:rCG43041, partial [Rattus norvegicus]